MAVDFMGLLMRKDAPRQAENAISPALKQLLPVGPLGWDKVRNPESTKADKANDRLVSIGWSLKSLDDAADSLLKSATRLEADMDKEARYWEQVLSVSDEGWAVCRMPRELHAIGVRFGFSEGAS